MPVGRILGLAPVAVEDDGGAAVEDDGGAADGGAADEAETTTEAAMSAKEGAGCADAPADVGLTSMTSSSSTSMASAVFSGRD